MKTRQFKKKIRENGVNWYTMEKWRIENQQLKAIFCITGMILISAQLVKDLLIKNCVNFLHFTG